MFTGFASENTPAIQVWDFSTTFANTNAVRSVSLADDCAPIQIFKTGATTTAINVYLPTCPIEGKQITITNQRYGLSSQNLSFYSSDLSGNGTNGILFDLGTGGSLVLIYTKQAISNGSGGGVYQSGWITLNQMGPTSANYGAILLGGSGNKASSAYATAINGTNNNSSSSYSSIVGGFDNVSSNQGTFVGGGQANTASGIRASMVGGNSSSASALCAFVGGGSNNTANGSNSFVIGGTYGRARSITGNMVFPGSSPISDVGGITQSALLVLGVATTNATATVLRSDTSAAGTSNQVILPNNSAYYVKGSIIANVTGGGNTKSWDFIATIKRGASAASTAIVGAVTLNVQAADAGASTWIVAITADTTNGGLAVTVTGQAATTIRWVAKLESTEVTY
jgi:hypothetical protein